MSFTWAIIGPGNIANDFCYDLQFVKTESCSIGAVYGDKPEGTKKFTEEKGGTPVESIEELILSNPDAVYVATPHAFHYEQVLQCLENKIPVLCEKPLAINEEQVSGLIKASQQNNTFLMEAMWTMTLPSMQYVRQLISDGKIGAVKHISANMSYVEPRDKSNRFFNPLLAGGSLLDMGVYTVYLAHELLGKPQSIAATGVVSKSHIDEACSMLLSYEDGSFAQLTSSIITKLPDEAFIYGDKGSIHIHEHWTEKPNQITYNLYNSEENNSFTPEWEGKGFHYEIEETISCIKAGKKESNLLPLQKSLDVVKTMDEIRKQIQVFYKIADEEIKQ